jgi:hypothetical protein
MARIKAATVKMGARVLGEDWLRVHNLDLALIAPTSQHVTRFYLVLVT